MASHAAHCAIPLLLLLAASARAQSWLPEKTPTLDTSIPEQSPLDWPAAPTAGTQTSFRVHNDRGDLTVVGMSVQQSRYPAFLLQLEVAPLERELTRETEALPVAPPAPDDKRWRTVHRLSLRYRF